MATKPAVVFSPAEYIAEAAMERGWTIWHFASQFPGEEMARVVLEFEMYAACGKDASLYLSDSRAADLARIFGTSKSLWLRLDAQRRSNIDRVADLPFREANWFRLSDPISVSPDGD